AEAEAKVDLATAVGHTPADAMLVLAIPNVTGLEANLKALVGPDADDMDLVGGLGEDLPEDAFDTAGPLVLIVPAPAQDPEGRDQAEPVLLLHIKDATAIKGEDAGAGIVKMPSESGKDVFVLNLDPWAMVCDHPDPIKAVMRAEKKIPLADDQKAALADHTVWVHLDPPSLAALAKRGMEDVQQQIKQQGGQGGPPQASLDMLNSMLDLVKDVTGVEVAADVTAEGIHVQADAHLAEGSHLAALAATGVAVKDYKAGLPVTDRLLVAAWVGVDWQKAIPPMKAMMKPIFDALTEGEDEETRKAVDTMWASYEKWGPIMGERVGMLLELPPSGRGLYQLAETYEIKDPEAYRKLLKEYMDASKAFMNVMMTRFGVGSGMPGMPPQVPHVDADITFEEAAETIEGVPVDLMRITFKVNMPEGAPPQAAAQVKQMVETIYGPDGMTFRMAILDGKGVAAMGGKEVMARALKAVKGQTPDLVTDPKVAEALRHVPEGQAVVLVSAAKYMYMAMGMVDRMMAGNLPPEVLQEAETAGHGPLQPPPPTDLVRFTGKGDGSGLSLTVDVPKSDLRAAILMAKKGAERMQFLMKKQQEMAQKQAQQGQTPPQ
ncbi:MAG: hypothetical protein U9R68_05725, partial [Planctomycetota bacterium]|nr:hypothetical protein [Planctomycetota bacterium]